MIDIQAAHAQPLSLHLSSASAHTYQYNLNALGVCDKIGWRSRGGARAPRRGAALPPVRRCRRGLRARQAPAQPPAAAAHLGLRQAPRRRGRVRRGLRVPQVMLKSKRLDLKATAVVANQKEAAADGTGWGVTGPGACEWLSAWIVVAVCVCVCVCVRPARCCGRVGVLVVGTLRCARVRTESGCATCTAGRLFESVVSCILSVPAFLRLRSRPDATAVHAPLTSSPALYSPGELLLSSSLLFSSLPLSTAFVGWTRAVLSKALELVEGCPCPDGCLACVHNHACTGYNAVSVSHIISVLWEGRDANGNRCS